MLLALSVGYPRSVTVVEVALDGQELIYADAHGDRAAAVSLDPILSTAASNLVQALLQVVILKHAIIGFRFEKSYH